MADKNFIQESDKDLLLRYYAGHNNYWLGILLPRYTVLIFGVCMKYLKNVEEAKDAVQQINLKVIDELPKHKVDYFKSWLYTVAKNYCLMQLRGKGQNIQPIPEGGLIAVDAAATKEEHWEKEITLQKLELAMQQLHPDQEKCIRLFYLEKFSYQEIAEKTSFAAGQVKSHIQNGKRNLKILIERMK